ncbi:MAG: hypothetical protein SFY81_08315 [Verrucomicrobiota bacterium]|nr:hypothetical protein [Verrucomicrobiota bacterium]
MGFRNDIELGKSGLGDWLNNPPHFCISGGGMLPEDLVGELSNAILASDKSLEILDQMQWQAYTNVSLTPLRNVRGIVLVWGQNDSEALVFWRHGRLWDWLSKWGKNEAQRVSWIILASVERIEVARQLSLSDAGTESVKLGNQKGYAVMASDAPIDALREKLKDMRSSGDVTDLITWNALQRVDRGLLALRSLRAALEVEPTNPRALMAAISAIRVQFAECPHEWDRYCRPNCHEHGRKWRKWLSTALERDVTESVTHIVQDGRALIPLLRT